MAHMPPRMAKSPNITWPAIWVLLLIMQLLPTSQSWAIWLYAMMRQLLPTLVVHLSLLPLLTVTNSRIVVLSPISTVVGSFSNLRSCGIAAMTAPGKIRQFLPTRAPSIMVTLLPIQVPSPISTFWCMTLNGSTFTLVASLAFGWMYVWG